MRLEAATVACQRHVHKVLVIAQVFEGRRDTALVVVPSQTEVLRVHHVDLCIGWGWGSLLCVCRRYASSLRTVLSALCYCIGF